MSRFTDKVVLVTGASSGIGAATAKRLAAEGARVFGIGRNQEGLNATQEAISSAGGTAHMATVDITNAQACHNAVTACVEQYGRLDVLINCAGRHIYRPLHDITEEQWLSDMATNLGGNFFLCQAAIPCLIDTGGNIVNISSLAGVEGQTYSATYCSAKHGVIGLTRALAVEFARENIRINAICPGGTNTPQLANIAMPEGADMDLIMRAACLRGMSEPEDIAALIAFLASDDAKAIHGAVYMVDQGKTSG